MSEHAVFDGVNLVVADMQASVDFYRLLGIEIPDTDPRWQPHHRSARLEGGVYLEFDSPEFARHWDRGWVKGMGVLGVRVDRRVNVDALFERMTRSGCRVHEPPFDAFWGARYAVIEDPDGNAVGISSPIDPDRKTEPNFE